MKQGKKRNISVITVLLFVFLIVSMITITVNILIDKNALITDGLVVTDFSIINTETGEEKSELVETIRGERLQFKINLEYNGEPLVAGDTLTFDLSQPNDFGYIFNVFTSVSTPVPIYDSNNVELGTWTYKNIGNSVGRFTITMTRDITNFSNISIITSDRFAYRHETKMAMESGILAEVVVGQKTKKFLLQQDELRKLNDSKPSISCSPGGVSNNSVDWRIVSLHGYTFYQNIYSSDNEVYGFEDSIYEAKFSNLISPIKISDIFIDSRFNIPTLDGTAMSTEFNLNSLKSYFKVVYQNEEETYEEFKNRIKASGAWSYGIYKYNDAEYSVIVYQGDLEDAPLTYEQLCMDYYNTNDFGIVLEKSERVIGKITQEQRNYLNKVFSTSNKINGKIERFAITVKATYEPVSS